MTPAPAHASVESLVSWTLVTLDPIRFAFEVSDSLYLNYLRNAEGGRGAPVEIKLPDEAEF